MQIWPGAVCRRVTSPTVTLLCTTHWQIYGQYIPPVIPKHTHPKNKNCDSYRNVGKYSFLYLVPPWKPTNTFFGRSQTLFHLHPAVFLVQLYIFRVRIFFLICPPMKKPISSVSVSEMFNLGSRSYSQVCLCITFFVVFCSHNSSQCYFTSKHLAFHLDIKVKHRPPPKNIPSFLLLCSVFLRVLISRGSVPKIVPLPKFVPPPIDAGDL